MFSKLSKQKSVTTLSLLIGSTLCLLAGVGISGAIDHLQGGDRAATAASAPAPAVSQGLPDFATLAKRVGPSVVNVSTTQVRKAAADTPSPFDSEIFWRAHAARGVTAANGARLRFYHRS
jgi:S1-C subfamily serine protease